MEPFTPERWAFLVRVSDLYYVEDRSQKEIADLLEVSRSSVSRLLTEARNRGVVEIRIHDSPPARFDLEAELRAALGLQAVTVVQGLQPGSGLRSLGDQTARLAERTMTTGATLALSFGTAVYEAVRVLRFEQIRGLRVVQMAGFEIRDAADTGWQQVRLCVERLGQDYRYIHAPLLVESADLHHALMTESRNAEIFEAARKASVAIIGVGSLDPDTSSLARAGHLNREQLQRCSALGSVGAINGHHYDRNGEPLSILNDRTVAMPLAWLREIGRVIAVARGPEKAVALIGAVRGGYCNALVTEPTCAEAILTHLEQGAVGEEAGRATLPSGR